MNKKKQKKTLLEVMEEDALYAKSVVITPRPLPLESAPGRPTLTNPEVIELYNYGYDIPYDILSTLLTLPRQTLIDDLKKVIYDACHRYEEISDKNNADLDWFALHALLLLRELKAGESLDTILDFLGQDEKQINYWLGDFITESMWSVIAACGQNRLDALLDFMKEPGRYTWSKAAVAEAVNQLALQNLISRESAINWLKEVLEYHLANVETIENLADTDLNGSLVGIFLDLEAHELAHLVKQMFDERLAPHSYAGDWPTVERELERSANRHWARRKPETIFETYDMYRKVNENLEKRERDPEDDHDGFDDSEDFDEDFYFAPPEPYVREEPKIGRNDPCPCGSGKKFKKCHGKDQ